ncbi:MAG: tetrathionate reductase family octaheme c-type cytochrome [Rhodocyclaceae bacterium]|nr:MAG: tetrathionate reductase family octaheme c-type cytochrome [Rhodocyclaceae bacterium]
MKFAFTRVALVMCCAGWLAVAGPVLADEAKPLKLNTTADHTKFKELKKQFNSGPEVTRACLACHTEAAGQIHRTKHWKWEYLNPATNQLLGKKHVVNNYCISIASNQAACTTCHVGYGWKDNNFDFTSEENVDCLVCHDTTGNYKKPPGMAGNVVGKDTEFPPGSGKIVKGIDLSNIAQKIGKTSRDTCGGCHFNGGGGDGVKHGDLDSSMATPDRELDVHMDAVGLDFTCATCHKTSSHDVAGSRYSPTAKDDAGARIRGKAGSGNPATCVACHGNGPHKQKKDERLNQHAGKIACQTCHIPKFARGGIPTKMEWDWSTSGKVDADGKQFTKKDAKGHNIYESRKGDFKLGENVTPEYAWFNGHVEYTLLTSKIEKSEQRTPINKLDGSPTDGKSMIWPMKVFRGTQPYDPVNKTLVTPHTTGPDGYWTTLIWDKAIETGMKDSGQPFSGKVDFIKTEMSWPITHMVAPKEKALACVECHSKQSRLAGIQGIYIPVRDNNKLLDTAGWAIVFLTLLGVFGHGALRIVSSRKH